MTARFISFEGIDGCGKSTQARLLAERLRAAGRDVVLTREPGGAPGAEEIRALVLTGDPARWSPETETALFTAARRDHLERTIRPALARGATVITDRFADSTRVYQGATRGDLRDLVDRLHDALIGVEPDLTLVLSLDPRKSLERSVARIMGNRSKQIADKMRHAERVRGLGHEGEASRIEEDAGGDLNEITNRLVISQQPASEPVEGRFEAFGLRFQEKLSHGFDGLAEEFPERVRKVDADGTPEVVAGRVATVIDTA